MAKAKSKVRRKPRKAEKVPSGWKVKKAVKTAKKRSPAKTETYYKGMVRGFRNEPGQPRSISLRDIARGFTAADGYDLNHVSEWTAAMKRKVTRYGKKLSEITAQPRRIYKTTDKKKLHEAMQIFQKDKGFEWKAAVIPGVPKYNKKGKEIPPKLSFPKPGIIRIHEKKYNNLQIRFDIEALIKNPRKEIQSKIDMVPKARSFRVMTNDNLIVMGAANDRAFIVQYVINLMSRYDGVKDLPKSSGNYGDDAKYHHFKYWISGLQGFEFSASTLKQKEADENRFNEERLKLQRANRARKERERYAKAKRKRGRK